ncbi:MAG: TetR/AcrR family transcriptional regulator [Clostridiales bacterium]|nr:TetR/AcrR family transcriptional regulator [Clostridiales bacterium]
MQCKKDEIRDKILNTSSRLFIKNGYENTSLQLIADKCYISKSNIYRYFSSKEEIYEVLVKDARQIFNDMADYFPNHGFAGKYTPDKIDEISTIVSKAMCEHRMAALIMLNSSEGRDRNLLIDRISGHFLEVCPVEDTEIKSIAVKLLVIGLSDVLLNNSEEEDIRKGLRNLMTYHYMGLDGLLKLVSSS